MAPSPKSPILRLGMLTTADRTDERRQALESLGDTGELQVFEGLRPGIRGANIAAWDALFKDPAVTHALLFQDDVRAPQGWHAALRRFLEVFPGQYAISLYSPRRAASQEGAGTYGHLLLDGRQWRGATALLLRREIIVGFHRWLLDEEYLYAAPMSAFGHHDLLLGAFLASRGEKIMVSAPSLFQSAGTTSAVDWPGEEWDAGAHFQRRLHPRTLLADRTRRM